MLALLRAKTGAFRLYLLMEFVVSVNLGLAQTTVVVYRIDEAGLSPLQLMLVGTVLEAAYFAFQLPTGILADAFSRRASVSMGIAVVGVGFLMEGLLPLFAGIAAAQVVRAFGFALVSGAQEAWIAGEIGEDRLARVYLRGTQAGLAGTLAGTMLSAAVATIGLDLPLLWAGATLLAVAVLLWLTMPESQPAPASRRKAGHHSLRVLLRDGADSVGAVWTLIRRGAGVPMMLGVVLFLGAWHESLDRLWGAHVLESFRLPPLAGLGTVGWFSLIAFVATLLGLLASQLVAQRLDESTQGGTLRALLLLIALLMLATLVFALAGRFAVALAAYWAAMALRPAFQPLVNAWLVKRTDPRRRATALSAKDMCDAMGQFGGGPAIGAIGSAFSLRAAMAAAGAVLVPALALLLAGLTRIAAPARPADDVLFEKHQTPEVN